MTNSKNVGKRTMRMKFDDKSYNKNNDYMIRKDDEETLMDNQDIKGAKEIVSIVGGVVRTIKSFENSNKNVIASKQDPNMIVQSRAIKENTKVLERLTFHANNLGSMTKENTKALVNRAKEGSKKLSRKAKTVISIPSKSLKAINKTIKRAVTSSFSLLKKVVAPITKPLIAISKFVWGGFKMIDNTLTKVLGPMFMEMAKSLAMISGIYILVEGVRQSIWHLMKKYEEGFTEFTESFGSWAGPLMNLAKSLKSFSEDAKNEGFFTALKNNFMSMLSSMGSLIYNAISRGMDHLIVAINNWWHNDDEDKQMTVEEYRNRRVDKDLISGRGADYGEEKAYAKSYARASKKREMTEQGLQYYIGSGLEDKLYDDSGNEKMSGRQISDYLRENNTVMWNQLSKLITEKTGHRMRTEAHDEAVKEFYYDSERKENYDKFVDDVGGKESYESLKDELVNIFLDKNRGTFHLRKNSSNVAFDRSLDKDDYAKGEMLGKSRRYANGDIHDLAKLDARDTLERIDGVSGLENEAKLIREKLLDQYGEDFLRKNVGNRELDKEERNDVDDVITRQREILESNTKSIDNMTEALTNVMGNIGGAVMMNNVKNNTTIVNPRTSLDVIERGVDLK